MNSDDKKQLINRREFVGKSSVAAAGTLLGNSLLAGGAYAAGNATLKLAVVGCGGRGTGAAVNAMKADPEVELVAVADAFQDAAQDCAGKLRAKFGDKRVKVTPESTFVGFQAYRGAIDMADVVILASTPGFRPEHFEYAVAQGKHVFMEKPVATDAPGVRRVLAAAREADSKKLNVVCGLQRRYQQSYLETLKRYRNGMVGEIIGGQVYWNSGGVWVRPRESGQTEMQYQMRNWYYFNWLCGDHILEQHIHNIDVANWFLDEYPVSARGSGGRLLRTGKDHGQIFDHHAVNFSYPSGAVISSHCRHMPGTDWTVEETFQATGGQIRTNNLFKGKGLIRDRNGKELFDHGNLFASSPYQVEHDRLFESIRQGGHINDAEHTAMSNLTAIMGRMATYSGEEIEWQDAMASKLRLVPDSAELDWDVKPPVMPDAEGNYPVPVPGETRVL